jgi:hypothetical protein
MDGDFRDWNCENGKSKSENGKMGCDRNEVDWM